MATSKFIKYFQDNTTGNPATGMSVWLVPQEIASPTYPTDYLVCTEHATRNGVYYRDNVPDDEYKIYIDSTGGTTPALYEEHIWLGDQRITTISDHFDPADSYRLKSEGIQQDAVTNIKIADYAVSTSKLGLEAVHETNIYDGSVTTNKIANLSITNQKLTTDSVSTQKIFDRAITTAKMANQTATVTSLTAPTPDYIGQPGRDANGSNYVAISTTGTMWARLADSIAAPSNLQASVSGADVTLTWLDNSANETGFTIADGNGVSLYTLAANTTSYFISGLAPGIYNYKVRAFNDTETSNYSNTVQVTVAETQNSWKLVGRGGGGYFRTIRFGQSQNNIISGGDRCSVYASSDGGTKWQDGGAGLLHARVEQIAVHPTTRSTMICATMGGVFRSTDNGNSWTNIFSDVFTPTRSTHDSLGYISAVAYNKTTPTIMYAASGGYHAQATSVNPFNFFKSTDSGSTWAKISSGSGGLATGGDTAFVIDTAENDANTVFLATKNHLYKSTDGGSTFTDLTSVPDGAMFVMVKPDDSSTVFYGKYGDYYNPQLYPQNLYKSTDGGSTWVNKTNGIDSTYSYGVEMHYDPIYKTELYLAISNGSTSLGNQIYKSTDNGENWSAIGFYNAPSNASNSDITPKTFDIYNGNLVFTRGSTLFTSEAHTMTAPSDAKWTSLDADVVTVGSVNYFKGRGNEFLDLFRADFHPTDHNFIFGAVADWRLVKSADGGVSWKNMTVQKPTSNYGTSLISAGDVAFCKTNDNVAFLSCYDQGGGASSDIGVMLRTEDANSDTPTWTVLDATSGLPYAPSGHDSRRLWEVVSNDRGDMFTSAYGAIYRSVYSSGSPNNVGLSWTQVATVYGNGGHFAIAPLDNSIMYFAMESVNNPGIWKSTDYGATWTSLSYTTTDILHTTGLAVDPTDSDIVWLTQTSYPGYNETYGGLWKIDTSAVENVMQVFEQTSDSDGVAVPYGNSYGIAIDPNDHNTMVMATHDAFQLSSEYANVWKGQGIWYTKDGWTTPQYLADVGHNNALGISLDSYNRLVYIGVDQRSAYQIDLTKL